MKCYVYWIKRKSFTDPFTEGYVGISDNPQERFIAHHYSKYRVGNAIRKYSDVELSILHECDSRKDALIRENQYRNKPNIGWNLNEGGFEPPRNHLTEDVRKKISETLKKRGTNPYSRNTHSKESLEKASKTKRERKYKWFHDPRTLERFMLPTNEEVPSHLVQGKVPKKEKIKKENKGNTKKWIVTSPEGITYEVENLKSWCKERSIPYLAQFSNRKNGWKDGWKGWVCQKK